MLAQFPPLARGLHAEEQRASEAFTEFDGHVPAAGKVLDPSAVARPVSPTQLEAAADCAFRHFLQRGLGVSALDEREKDADTWLDAGTRGSERFKLFRRVKDPLEAARHVASSGRAAAGQKIADPREMVPPAL